MWLVDLLKALFAAYKAQRAARAAAELPQGAAAITSIEADGKTIEAQLRAAGGPAR